MTNAIVHNVVFDTEKDYYYTRRKSKGQCTRCNERPAAENSIHCEPCKILNRACCAERKQRLIIETFNAYGPCDCCDESTIEFLSIDHITGGGSEHRRNLKPGHRHGAGFYRSLKHQGFPKDKYRSLCGNCNISLGVYGYCPHKSKPILNWPEEVERILNVSRTDKEARKLAKVCLICSRSTSGFVYCDYHRFQALLRTRQIKTDVISKYGDNCACCGVSELEFLTINHDNGGGTKHRQTDSGAKTIYYWLKKNNYPSGYSVLCQNCNFASWAFGTCPHQRFKAVQKRRDQSGVL